MGRVVSVAPGLVAALALAAAARLVGERVPGVGPPVWALVAGMAVASARPASAALRPGLSFASKRVLQGSIVVLGLNLSFTQVVESGRDSLPVLVATFAAALVSAVMLSRALRLDGDLPLLIGVGTAVCGASAIAATSSVTGSRSSDVAYAMTTIFVFNVAAVLAFPALGHLFDLSDHAFGVWAGTAVNDTSSVVAAASAYSEDATTSAVVVKLTRTLAIVPICVGVAALRSRRGRSKRTNDAPAVRLRSVLPMFIAVFIAAVTINTVGLVPSVSRDELATLAGWMITVAAAAIGLTTRPREVRSTGMRPLFMGAGVWLAVAGASLVTQALTGQLS